MKLYPVLGLVLAIGLSTLSVVIPSKAMAVEIDEECQNNPMAVDENGHIYIRDCFVFPDPPSDTQGSGSSYGLTEFLIRQCSEYGDTVGAVANGQTTMICSKKQFDAYLRKWSSEQ